MSDTTPTPAPAPEGKYTGFYGIKSDLVNVSTYGKEKITFNPKNRSLSRGVAPKAELKYCNNLCVLKCAVSFLATDFRGLMN
jgi:hypothetical protein